jgi:hypothetical protein
MQITAQAETPNGKSVPVPSPIALQLRGPVVQVAVMIEQSAAKALLSQGKTAPSKSGLALIDTGASNSCIDEQAAQDLGYP